LTGWNGKTLENLRMLRTVFRGKWIFQGSGTLGKPDDPGNWRQRILLAQPRQPLPGILDLGEAGSASFNPIST